MSDWFSFGVLVCWGLLGVSRAVRFHAQGTRVIVGDRQRTLGQMFVDTLALACLLVWAYEVVANAWSSGFHVGPAFVRQVIVDSIFVKVLGGIALGGGILLYALALHHLGASWRLGIDRMAPGPLVTTGIYARTRHPIYVAFDLLFIGTFLMAGHIIFLVLALVWVPVMHASMLREERFLMELYGDAYREYCQRVGRYFSFRQLLKTQAMH